MISVEEVLVQMIGISQGNYHDINHFLKVWTYAHTIGTLEQLDEKTLYTLEAAAIIHDIACPVCREKYGNTNGKYQEKESPELVAAFLEDLDMPKDIKERVNFLVSHHHTIDQVDGMDYRILLEADFLVNAEESQYPKEAITHTKELVFRTETGCRLLDGLFIK